MNVWFSSPEAAAYCGLSETLIRSAVSSGDLAFYQIGRLRKYRPEDLDAWLDSTRRVVKPIRIVRDVAS